LTATEMFERSILEEMWFGLFGLNHWWVCQMHESWGRFGESQQ
jgi:hypothetical protein